MVCEKFDYVGIGTKTRLNVHVFQSAQKIKKLFGGQKIRIRGKRRFEISRRNQYQDIKVGSRNGLAHRSRG